MHDELIYTSPTITPEQQALLGEPNSRQYPAERESSEGKGTQTSANGQEQAQQQTEELALDNDERSEAERQERLKRVDVNVFPEEYNVNSGGIFRKGYTEKKKNVEQNAELSAPAATTQGQSFVQTGLNEGSSPAVTHSDNQRSSDGKGSDNSSNTSELGEKNAAAEAEANQNPTLSDTLRQAKEKAQGGNQPKSDKKDVSLRSSNLTNEENDTISESVPQGEHGAETSEDSRMEEAAARLQDGIQAASRNAQASGRRGIEKYKRQAEREGGQLLMLPSAEAEEAGALSSLTSDLPSTDKGSEITDTRQEKTAKNSEVNQTPTAGQQSAGSLLTSYERALERQKIDRWNLLCKEVLVKKTKELKVKYKKVFLESPHVFALFDSNKIDEPPFAIVSTPKEVIDAAFNYDIADFEVLYVHSGSPIDLYVTSLFSYGYDNSYDENGHFKEDIRQALVDDIALFARDALSETDGRKTTPEQPRNRTARTKEQAAQLAEEIETAVKGFGVPVKILHSAEEIPATEKSVRAAIAQGLGVKGWFSGNTAYIYLPNAESVEDAMQTILHEAVAHKGLRGLLGKGKFKTFCRRVWNDMSYYERRENLAYAFVSDYPKYGIRNAAQFEAAMNAAWNRLDAETKNQCLEQVFGKRADRLTVSDYFNNRKLYEARALAYFRSLGLTDAQVDSLFEAAADECVAFMAESGVETNRTLWDKILTAVREALRSLGVKLEMTERDIRDLLAASYANERNKGAESESGQDGEARFRTQNAQSENLRISGNNDNFAKNNNSNGREENTEARLSTPVHQRPEGARLEQNPNVGRRGDGSRMVGERAGEVSRVGNRSDLRVFGETLAASRAEHSEHSERNRRQAEAERLVNTAKEYDLLIQRDEVSKFGEKYSKRTGESEVYIDKEAGRVYKVKDPYAKSAMKKGVEPEDALYEHLVHNLIFPETAYTFEGISEESGDVRIVLSQTHISSYGQPTQQQIAAALAAKGLHSEDRYTFGNDLVSVTDIEGDNVLLDEQGNVRFIDPIISFKKPIADIVEALSGQSLEEYVQEETRQRATELSVSDFARKHNVNEQDVANYADYMSIGNLMGANAALGNIRHKLRTDHMGTPLREFAKLFAPVRNELCERFGNIEELREQYAAAERAQQSAMEAARKKAEQEAEAERERLQEFRDMSEEQLDEEYFKAVEADDRQRMRDLVNEAARRKGYGDTTSDYQGVGAWAAPSNPGYESNAERRAEIDENGGDCNVEDIAAGHSPQPDDYFTNTRAYGNNTPHGRESAKAINKAIEEIRQGKKATIKVYRAVPTSVKESSVRNGDWVTPSRAYADMHGNNRLEGDYRIIEQEVPAEHLWWDANDINEWGYDDGKSYAYRNTRNNRKLSDLVTYDDNGNVIPLSERFNAERSDIRYRLAADRRAAFNAAMQMLDKAGVPVEIVSNEQMERLAEMAGVALEAKRKSAPETALPGDESPFKGTVVSSTDGAKILNNLRNLAKEYEEKSERSKTFIGDVATTLDARQYGSGSQYATFETKNGDIVTIRLADHNASTAKFDNAGRNNGISIVISRRPNNGIKNDGKAHIVEFYYNDKKLQKAEGKPLAQIIRSIEQALYSGEYKDTTGLAERQEANGKIHLMIGYHGSGADYNEVDLSHVGEGEGAQAYGWGFYVTMVKGIGKTYAKAIAGRDIRIRINRLANHVASQTELIKNRKRDIRENEDYDKYARSIQKSLNKYKRDYKAAERAGNKHDMEFYQSLINISEQQLERGHHKHLIDSFWEDINNAQADIDKSNAEITNLKKELKKKRGYLYTIEIPDDTGSNYLDWVNGLTEQQWQKIMPALMEAAKNKFPQETEENITKWIARKRELLKDNEGRIGGAEYFNVINGILGSPKAASEFLSRLGFTGIKYPAEFLSGGRADGAKNYVIFNESDLKIIDKVKFLKGKDGTIYGAAMGGKIYLNRSRLNPNTPIHEYTHLWDEACERANPEYWRQGVELMKQTPLWDEVKNDPGYADLTTDSEIASEVHSRLTGARGEQLLTDLARRAREEGTFGEMARAVSVVHKLRDWLRGFWTWVKDTMTPWTREEARSVSTEDFVNRPLRDLAEGTRFRDTSESIEPPFATRRDMAVNNRGYVHGGLNGAEVKVVVINGTSHFDTSKGIKALKKDVVAYANEHGIIGTMTEKETNGKGKIAISKSSIEKMVDDSAMGKSVDKETHLSILPQLREVIAESVMAETHPDYNKGSDGKRNVENGFNADNLIHRCYGVVSIDGKLLRVKLTLKETTGNKAAKKAYSYEVTKIELLDSTNGEGLPSTSYASNSDMPDGQTTRPLSVSSRNSGTSDTPSTELATYPLANLLQNIEKSYDKGKKLLEESKLADERTRYRLSAIPTEGGSVNEEEANARYRIVEDKAEIERLNNEPTIKVYRAMSLIDGKLYPPMSKKIGTGENKTEQNASEIGKWEMSDERPDIVRMKDGNEEYGYVYIEKDNAKGLTVAYNPYFHTSRNPLNDQFAEAYQRPNLVTVEVEVPASELTSGYKAEKAKNAVGEVVWKAGPVNRQLSKGKKRKVILSRWAKPIRVVPDSEVAQRIAELLEGENVAIPDNVVTPSLLAELQKLGIPIKETGKAASATLEEVNEQFNNELQQQIDGTLPVGHIYRLGNPSAILQSTGFPNLPIELSSTKLAEKAAQRNHEFEISDVKDLVHALNAPVAVFSYGDKGKSQNVIVEIERDGKKFVVGVHFNQNQRGIAVNDIRGLFPKDTAEWLNWINQGKLLYVDKKRIQDLITQQRTNLAEVGYLDLESATKVVENFENPKLSEEKESGDTRYRFIGERGAANLDAAEEATTRLDNLGVARQMEAAFNEKKARIEKLRQSKPVEITGEEIEPSNDMKQYKKNALEYGKKLQGSYTNNDTGTTVQLQRGRRNGGINEVLQHDYKDKEHLQSIAAIPQIIEQGIFIESEQNTDKAKNPDVAEYQYYVCGLKIGEEDYTVRSVIAVDRNGNRYYDHKLTRIEKGKLLDFVESQAAKDGFGTTPGTKPTTDNPLHKDKRLLLILQANDRENARSIKIATGWERGADGKWRYETEDYRLKDNWREIVGDGRAVLADILENTKELFDAYPAIRNTKVALRNLNEGDAAYSEKSDIIFINSNVSNADRVIAHEIQHAIQKIEDFSRGGNLSVGQLIADETNPISPQEDEFIKSVELYDRYKDTLRNDYTLSEYIHNLAGDGEFGEMSSRLNAMNDEELRAEYDKYKARQKGQTKTANEIYHSLSGEVEARNVESRMNMTPEERRASLAEETEDVAREDQIFLEQSLESHAEATLEEVNARFNEELAQQVAGTLPAGHVYSLGMPSRVLLASGLPNLPIEMTASRLSDKSMQENHPFDLSEVENLPRAIHNPMAVFRSATHIGSFVVMTEIEHNGKNYVVAIRTNSHSGRIMVNSIRSVYPKNNIQLASWIVDDLMEYADKEKVAKWLSKQRSNSADVRKLFNHAAKIVNDFENPKLSEEKISAPVRYRVSKPYDPQRETISDFAERVAAEYGGHRAEELERVRAEIREDARKAGSRVNAAVSKLYDTAKPLEHFQEAFAKRGALLDERTDAYNDFFRSKARATSALREFESERMQPIYEAMRGMAEALGENGLADVVLMNGEEIPASRKITLYLQAKDMVEARERGLVERGAEGFQKQVRYISQICLNMPTKKKWLNGFPNSGPIPLTLENYLTTRQR